MTTIVRHRGSIAATGTRCTVVFRELPNQPETCLIYEADSLPDYFRDAVDSIVGREGQKSRDLFEVLHRHTLPDGQNILTALHNYKLLHPKPTKDIMMHPTSESKIRLDELNIQLRELDGEVVERKPETLQDKYNPYAETAESLDHEESVGIATRLLRESEELKAESARKLEHAYNLRPDLRPETVALDEVTAPSIADMGEIEALMLFEELQDRFGGIAATPAPELPPTAVVIDLDGLSQRKATEAIKEAWRKANPDKVKDK